MDAERWLRLSPHLDELLELEPAARGDRLSAIAAADAALAAELAKMLALEQGRADFLAEPIVPPKPTLGEGTEIGPYRLESLLGEGGMGQVWCASRADGLYQRRVALKLLRPGLTDENLRLRFARERQILARLAHPHIAGLLDAGVSSDGVPYLALEYVEGEPITRYWQRLDVPLDARLRMFRQVCAAVSHAHANLVVHCDLKPSNILVTRDGQVRLLDFGIAKLLDGGAPRPDHTRTGARAFTLHYAAPEQIRGAPVTTMTDVYSLGVVLYELLTGTKPYRLKRQSDAEWEEAILAHDPVRPSVMVLRQSELQADRIDRQALRRRGRRLVGDLDNIVMRTLCKSPDQRYPSVEALSQDLARHLEGRPVEAQPQSLLYRGGKYVMRHRWALAGGSVAVTVVGLAVGMTLAQNREAVEEARRAQAMRGFIFGVFEEAGDARDGRALNLPSLLDSAVERGERDLAREPRAHAELVGVVARLRTGLGDYAQAQALLERQAALLGRASDVPPSLWLEAAAQRGDVMRRMGTPRRCVGVMTPHLAVARRDQAHLPSQAAEFYAQLGRCQRALGESALARDLFVRALNLRRQVRAPGAAVAEIESRLDLAGLQADRAEYGDALRGYRTARIRLDAEVGPRHPLQIEIARQIGAVERRHGHPGRAERELVRALGVAQDVLGSQHPITLSVRRELADALIEQFRFRDAALPMRSRHAVLGIRLGPVHPDLRDSHRRLARLDWELGRIEPALASLDHALAISRELGDGEGAADTLLLRGEMLREAGRAGEARPALEQARELRVAYHGTSHWTVADVDRAIAQLEGDAGASSAVPRLVRAIHFLRLGLGPTHPRTRAARLALARQQAVSGDPAGLPVLEVLAASARGELQPQPLAWRAAAYADAIRCLEPGGAVATRHMARLLARVRRTQPDGSVVQREIERLLDQCQRPRVEFMPTGTQ